MANTSEADSGGGGAGGGGDCVVKLEEPPHQSAAAAGATSPYRDAVESSSEASTPKDAQDRVHRKLFECDVCNMKFSNGANMRRHKMRHTGVKPYECRVCQKRFFRKDHLAEHFTTHTKTLPYHCPICNRGFQRQIAMRAHFQNEHVGQHDLVKSCPLCSYRAGSMKSLRIHFFNRHGIDLDNPGPAGSQASLLAAAAAAQQNFSTMEGTLNSLSQLTGSLSVSVTGSSTAANFSDSGDSTGDPRSTDNATPPMHFLTPHVEISMADAPVPVFSPTPDDQKPLASGDESAQRVNGGSNNGDSNSGAPCSPQSADSNSNAPTSTHHSGGGGGASAPASVRIDQETSITPSISLIPIKQEPTTNEEYDKRSSPSIKVSPLKSLLRDDLKRKIVSKRSQQSPSNGEGSTNGGAVISSSGLDQPTESSLWRSLTKRGGPSGLQCVFCGIAFPDQTLYFLHKGCHSDANPWKCNICGEQCCNVYEFNSHLLSKSHQ